MPRATPFPVAPTAQAWHSRDELTRETSVSPEWGPGVLTGACGLSSLEQRGARGVPQGGSGRMPHH